MVCATEVASSSKEVFVVNAVTPFEELWLLKD